MAVTAIWDIKGRIDRVIGYVMNPQKTQMDLLHTVEDVLNYATDDSKTEQMQYVTGINCEAENAVTEFRFTKMQWEKCDGIVAFHAYQSFRPGEVDPETAHKIGVALARELWGDRFEVVVATHLNTEHCHNHIVINSVSFKDGKRYNDCKESYRKLREASDRLCKEYQLSVIRNPSSKGKHYAQWSAEKNGKPTYRSLTCQDIERAIAASVTEQQFRKAMEQMGYTLRFYTKSGQMRKHPSVLAPGAKKAQRLDNLGYDYEEIVERILQNVKPKPLLPQEYAVKKHQMCGTFSSVAKRTDLWAIHFRYCCYLKQIKRNPASVLQVSDSLREDLIQMDRLFDQVKYLAATKFQTLQELYARQDDIKAKMDELTQERKELYNAEKRAKRKDDPHEVEVIQNRLSSISEDMRGFRRELAMCHAIAKRSESQKENPIRKEQNEHEPRRRSSRTNCPNVPQRS